MISLLNAAARHTRRTAFALIIVLLTLGGAAYAVTSTAPASFSVTPALSTQTVVPGDTTTDAITLMADGSYADNVSLSVIGLPAGVSLKWSTNPVFVTSTLASSANLSVSTSSSTPVGSYQLVISGTDSSGQTQSTNVTLDVQKTALPDFALSVAPGSQDVGMGNSVYISAGGTAPFSVGLQPLNGFVGSVALSVKTFPGALLTSFGGTPTNGNATTTATVATGQTNSTSTGLTVGSTNQSPPGTYTVVVTATSGSITHSAVGSVSVDLFSATGSVPGTMFPGGSSSQIPVTLSNPYNFTVTATGLTTTVRTNGNGYVLDPSGNPIMYCMASWFKVTQSNLSSTNPVQIPANGQSALNVGSVQNPSIQMLDSNASQDACKGKQIALDYIGTGEHS